MAQKLDNFFRFKSQSTPVLMLIHTRPQTHERICRENLCRASFEMAALNSEEVFPFQIKSNLLVPLKKVMVLLFV